MINRRTASDNGVLVISLDFEMYWGMADITSVDEMTPIMQNVHNVVPRLLDMFKDHGIRATWATVGALMAENSKDFLKYLPDNIERQTAVMLQKIGIVPEDNEKCPRNILFAPELVRLVSNTDGQEIATHTYSHYYCEETESTPDAFAAEIDAALKMASDKGYLVNSAVFPRNQVADEFLCAMDKVNALTYRGNETGWIAAIKPKSLKLWQLAWYLDNYFPLQKRCSYKLSEISDGGRMNVRKSRFFKPFRAKYSFAEKIKLRRYKKEMLKAAKRGEIYHLCWHPHNFASDTEVNFAQMEELLDYYSELNKKYGMVSMNMNDVVESYMESVKRGNMTDA